jgi:phosphate acetyltransferase
VPPPAAALEFLERIETRLLALPARPRIVFPEGEDPRVRAAAERLAARGLVEPVLVPRAPATDAADRYAALLYERRRRRGMSEREARELARRPLYFAALMTAAGDADGFVGGAANSTADTVRAALLAIGPAPGIAAVSSFFVLASPVRAVGCNGLFIAADCAVLIDPTAAQLAGVARAAAASTRLAFECEPAVGLLPGKDEARIAEAAATLRAAQPGLDVRTGDAAFDPQVNTLVFPDLHAANIGYKLVEWLGGGSAFGPMLQGLNKPANDLSRAAGPEEIYTVALITALQAQAQVPA